MPKQSVHRIVNCAAANTIFLVPIPAIACGSVFKSGCYSSSGARSPSTVTATVGIAFASAVVTMVLLGSQKGRRAPGWLLFFALLCLMASLQVGLAREVGECDKNNVCPFGLCCSSAGYCGTGDRYCGSGCVGSCNVSSPSKVRSESIPGACISNTCEVGLCCSKSGFCGHTEDYCGFGCQSGPCYSSSGSKGLSTGAKVGAVAVAGILGAILVVAWLIARGRFSAIYSGCKCRF